jgi:hypothetical protein
LIVTLDKKNPVSHGVASASEFLLPCGNYAAPPVGHEQVCGAETSGINQGPKLVLKGIP